MDSAVKRRQVAMSTRGESARSMGRWGAGHLERKGVASGPRPRYLQTPQFASPASLHLLLALHADHPLPVFPHFHAKQAQVKPGLGADPSAASFSGSGARFGRSSSYGSFGAYGGGYGAALMHRRRIGGYGSSPGFVRGGALVPSSDGAGLELRPSPGSAAAQVGCWRVGKSGDSAAHPPTRQLCFRAALRALA